MLKQQIRISWLILIIPILIVSCTTIDLFEKTVSIPNHEWKSDFKPEFDFDITDTLTHYQVFFVIRHTEEYNFKNIWINLYSQQPGDTIRKAQYELQLATNEKWLGTGMDDIYEHRIQLTNPVKLQAGKYKLITENIMREDPLEHVLNVGIRIEKVK